jgi:hypothetical protein
MTRVLRFLGATTAAVVVSAVGAVFVVTAGLVVPMRAVWPVTLVMAALLAAVAASWVGNVLARDRARLLAVVATSVVAALVLSIITGASLYLPALGMLVFGGSLFVTVAGCAVVLSVVAAAAALRLRGERGRLGRGGVVALVLAAAVLVARVMIEGSGLIPWIPETPLSYGLPLLAVQVGLLLLAVGALLAALGSCRNPARRGLATDAWLTLALVAAGPGTAWGTFYVLYSTMVMCSG